MSKILEAEIRSRSNAEALTPQTVGVAIAGATGYVGRELLTLIARHPSARVVRLMSSSRGGRGLLSLEATHPTLRGRVFRNCEPLDAESLVSTDVDLVFLATPHETSHELVPQLLERGLRVVDLSGAFRLKQSGAYVRWYGFEHRADATLRQAVYGLPDLNTGEIRKARLVSNPGCYATSIILGLAPLVRAGWVDVEAGIIADSKSGASGAGRAPKETLQFCEVNENLRAYGLFNHRHVPEMLQALGIGEEYFTFTPHLLPITRGILSTIYVRLAERRTLDQIVALFRNAYSAAPLIRVYEDGSLPEIQAVAHTNFADLGFGLDESTGRLIVVSALDNLGKGAAGQAIENLNLMFGYAQETGLA